MTRGLKKCIRKLEANPKLDADLLKEMFPTNYEKALKFFGRKKNGKETK